MSVDDLQALYSELRGSRSAPAIMDARAFFLERQMQDAHAKLQEAYDKYHESRQRILRQDPEKHVDAKAKDRDQQIRRLKRKQEKAREIVGLFEEYLKQLQRLAEKEKTKEDSKAQSQSVNTETENTSPAISSEVQGAGSHVAVVKKDSIDEGMLEHFSALIGDRQLEFVSSQFSFIPLLEITDVRSDAVYLLRKRDRCLLLNAETDPTDDSVLLCVDLNNANNHIQLSPEAMVRLSKKRKLVLLIWE